MKTKLLVFLTVVMLASLGAQQPETNISMYLTNVSGPTMLGPEYRLRADGLWAGGKEIELSPEAKSAFALLIHVMNKNPLCGGPPLPVRYQTPDSAFTIQWQDREEVKATK